MPPPPKHQPAAKGAAHQKVIPRVAKQKEKTTKTSGPLPSPRPARRPPSTSRALPRLLPAALAARLEGAHRPAALVLASSLLMQASVDVYETGIFTAGAAEAAAAAATTMAATTTAAVSASAVAAPSPLPALAGAALGLLYACALLPLAAARRTTARDSVPPERPLRAVVTGGSRGLGKAMAREHLLAGDSVVVAARDRERLLRAARELSEETGAELVLLEEKEEEDPVASPTSSSSSASAASAALSASASSSPLSAPAPFALPRPTITPIACDVSDAASVSRLVSESLRAFGKEAKIDCFYANAGDSGSLRGFGDSDPGALARVVSTNLLGAVLCSRAAMEAMTMAAMGEQEGSSPSLGGHIFLVEGAGSDGFATPGYAAYGATKAAIAQLAKSLAAEEREKEKKRKKKKSSLSSPSSSSSSSSSARGGGGGGVGFHALSPGLVLTPLLLNGVFPTQQGTAEAATATAKPPSFEEKARALAFDALAEHPETAAAFLVPRARSLVALGDASSAVRYLTPLRALARLLAAPLRRGRHFDAETAAPRWEASDGERLFGAKTRRRSRRDRARAAARGGSLALSFAASSAALFVMLVTGGGGGGV